MCALKGLFPLCKVAELVTLWQALRTRCRVSPAGVVADRDVAHAVLPRGGDPAF